MIEQLIKSVSSETISSFMRVKMDNFTSQKEDLEFDFDHDRYANFSRLIKEGDAIFENGDELIVVSCRQSIELTSKTGKKAQYEIAKKILKQNNNDAGIFVFYDETGNFRFSLVTVDYIGAKRNFSDFRRYTYYVDPLQHNNTFKQRNKKFSFDSIDSIFASI